LEENQINMENIQLESTLKKINKRINIASIVSILIGAVSISNLIQLALFSASDFLNFVPLMMVFKL